MGSDGRKRGEALAALLAPRAGMMRIDATATDDAQMVRATVAHRVSEHLSLWGDAWARGRTGGGTSDVGASAGLVLSW